MERRHSSYKKTLPCGRKRSEPHLAKPRLSDAINRLEIHVAKNKLKRSRSRQEILKTIFKHAEHFTIPELVQKVLEHNPDVAFATIYRSIPVFLEAGVLKKSLINTSGQAIYELDFGVHHNHIVCRDCDEIFEFDSCEMNKLLKTIAKKSGISISRYEHVLIGRCEYALGAI